MLFTRCPNCETTYRVTDEALHKADGQMRCGSCTHIFNVYGERREGSAAHAPGDDELSEAGHVQQGAARILPDADREVTDNADSQDTVQTGEEVAIVLQTDEGPATPGIVWFPDPSQQPSSARQSRWRYGSVAALLLLIGQATHHYRSELAAQAAVGPTLQQVYGLFGATLVPYWDVDQYRVIDSVVTADPNVSGQGGLIISARIHNRGPQAQPYPHVHLELTDRFETAVGSRIFRPSEYLTTNAPADTLMAAGDTTQARLTVVDPGPDAYGFELDVCVESELGQLNCATDRIFQ